MAVDRREFLKMMSVAPTAAVAVKQAPSGHPIPAPNMIVIIADDLGFSDLGCFGAEIATPTSIPRPTVTTNITALEGKSLLPLLQVVVVSRTMRRTGARRQSRRASGQMETVILLSRSLATLRRGSRSHGIE